MDEKGVKACVRVFDEENFAEKSDTEKMILEVIKYGQKISD